MKIIKLDYQLSNNKDIYIDNTPNLKRKNICIINYKPTFKYRPTKKLVDKFNAYLNDEREKYHSLFLTNYRESKDIARKRISFDLVYKICQYLLKIKNTPPFDK